jgi:hypothetical protein
MAMKGPAGVEEHAEINAMPTKSSCACPVFRRRQACPPFACFSLLSRVARHKQLIAEAVRPDSE